MIPISFLSSNMLSTFFDIGSTVILLVATFTLSEFTLSALRSIMWHFMSYNENMEEKVNTFREIMREERRKLNDVLTKKTKSEYYGKFIEIYNTYIKK